MNRFLAYDFREASYKISTDTGSLRDRGYTEARKEIIQQRDLLEEYIAVDPSFASSMAPIEVSADAPAIAREMADAAGKTGVGPMAAVAGAIAWFAAKAALESGSSEGIVENGGDVACVSGRRIEIGLYPGARAAQTGLALSISANDMPLGVCSSSSVMGHSLSFGDCDLATVVACDAVLADAAATALCNAVKDASCVNAALEAVAAIPGVLGALAVYKDIVGIAGELPGLHRYRGDDLRGKITAHPAALIPR